MDKAVKQKTSSGKIILLVCIVLVVAVVVFALLNSVLAKEKSRLSLVGEIAVLKDGQEIAGITPEILQKVTAETFTASQKSSGNGPVERSFTGVPLIEVLNKAKVSLDGSESVSLGSVDGYTVIISAQEVADSENVWLVWEADGEPLTEDGPYMVVIRKDPFSQRWSKMLCEIDILSP